MKSFFKKILLPPLILGGYFYLLSLGNIISVQDNSSKITSQKQLEQLIKQERSKIDSTNNSKIEGFLVKDKSIVRRSTKISDNSYTIKLNKNYANLPILRHELYHILDGHFEKNKNFPKDIKYFFIDEPQATIYSTTGLKL